MLLYSFFQATTIIVVVSCFMLDARRRKQNWGQEEEELDQYCCGPRKGLTTFPGRITHTQQMQDFDTLLAIFILSFFSITRVLQKAEMLLLENKAQISNTPTQSSTAILLLYYYYYVFYEKSPFSLNFLVLFLDFVAVLILTFELFLSMFALLLFF